MSTLKRETKPAQGHQPAILPQHEKKDGTFAVTGENNPFPMYLTGWNVVEQKTQANAVAGTVTFSTNIEFIELYNADNANTGVFNVNGISLTVPPGKSFKAKIGGTPRATVTVTGSTNYILTRYE